MNVQFRTNAPWTVLFGASGSGKSTILRVVAGLERLRTGHAKRSLRRGRAADPENEADLVRILGTTVVDSQAGLWMAPHKRPVRWMGQQPYLFPWLSVESNLSFGLSQRGVQVEQVARALEGFHLTELRAKRVADLSGGEAQQVAVARTAVAASGRLLLLDEPFAGLDASVRDRLIEDLRRWLNGSPIVSVTHDVGEAFLLEAEIVRISEGRVVAQGPVQEVLVEERRQLIRTLGAR